jgi:hypothetical protein
MRALAKPVKQQEDGFFRKLTLSRFRFGVSRDKLPTEVLECAGQNVSPGSLGQRKIKMQVMDANQTEP